MIRQRALPALALLLFFSGNTVRANEVETVITDEGLEFTPEETARMIYLYARMGQARKAERMSREFLKENDRHRNVLLVICALYAEQGRRVDLARAARRYLSHYPGDSQGLYYLASAEFQSGHYTEAVRILRELAANQQKGVPSPYLADIAADTWLMGDWKTSLEAHLELLRSQQLSPALAHALRRQLDELYREHLDWFSLGVDAAIFDTGSAVRPTVANETQTSKRTRFRLTYSGDYVSLRDRGMILGGSHYRQQAAASLKYTHDTLWSSGYTLGAYEGGALAGARLDYERRGRRAAWIKADYNTRATDSLALEALDGRRHEVGVGYTQHFTPRTSLTVAPYIYRTELEGHSLGHGAGVQWRLGHKLFLSGPAVTLGLRGIYDEFSPSDRTIDPKDVLSPSLAPRDRLGMLVTNRFNRQGIDLETVGHIGWPNRYRLFTSVDYDIERVDFVWGAGAELTHRPRKSIDLTLRVEYASSGNRANADSGAVLISTSATFRY